MFSTRVGDESLNLLCDMSLSCQLASLPVVSRLCLCAGCLAMLSVDTLCKQYQPGLTLLTSSIGQELISCTAK